MEGDKFSWFAKNYLRKRPRYSPTSFPDEQMASTSTSMPSTSSATSNRRLNSQRTLYEPSDEQLLKWQEKQISKCIVDNTLNRVVESYITFWEEENGNNSGTRNELEREAQLVSYHTNRAQSNFEDSAIMWAIDQHGLQQHSHNLFNDNRTETMSTSSSSISLSSPPHLASQDDLCSFNNAEELSKNPHSDDKIDENRAQHLIEGKNTECHETKQGHTSPGKSMEQFNACKTNTNELINEPTHDEHFDFLEAAVSAAIQEKGLASYSMQKSPKR